MKEYWFVLLKKKKKRKILVQRVEDFIKLKIRVFDKCFFCFVSFFFLNCIQRYNVELENGNVLQFRYLYLLSKHDKFSMDPTIIRSKIAYPICN